MPTLSVVIAAHDAEATLGATLDGLAAQELPGGGELEVIVVDDGSSDRTAAIAEAAGARVIRGERQGPAGARATGVAASSAPLLGFVDADCVPEPGWAAAGVAALASADLVQGRVRPAPETHLGPFDRTLWVEGDIGLYQTANLLISRHAYDRAGGFDTFVDPTSDARGHFGEDVLLGWAARRAGARAEFCGEAVVRHAVFPRGPRAYIAERARLAYFPELARRVPELRSTMFWARAFLSARTAMLDLALLAVLLAVARRRPALAVAALPYAWRLLIVARSRSRDRPLALVAAADLVADLVGCVALARGSARARSLLL